MQSCLSGFALCTGHNIGFLTVRECKFFFEGKKWFWNLPS